MSEWGRKKYQNWPSRKPLATYGALVVAVMFFGIAMWWQYTKNWTFVQRFYLPTYAKTWVRGQMSPKSQTRYSLINIVNKQGQRRIALDGEIQPMLGANGRVAYVLTDTAAKDGFVKPTWDSGYFNDAPLHRFLGHWIYNDQTLWDFVRVPAYESLFVFVLALFVAVPRDRKRALLYKHGRRLRGPEMVSTGEFNTKLGHTKGFTTYLPDGIALINENQNWIDRVFRKSESRWVRIPRDREAMHFLIVGDSGHGKSATIRQALSQIWERGETAIVYDPAMEYLPQFYDPKRGDVILNPLDARCPFWTPSDEVPHPAEALTLSASLFPDQGRENRFFVEAPRKIFAHLLNLKPTPEQLTDWLCKPEEIDKRVEGTEMAVMIDRQAGPQRSGVLGSMNMVADALKLLPREAETECRWSAAEWAKKRNGWIFITSKPTVRERLRPLISLWLDLLVLRTMDEGSVTKRKTWFVLDELASLQHLPQFKTAITESRKSNNPMILGFQGKAQIETLYGTISEALLSQPATKIYLKTSEPMAAEWISKAIGEIEIERYRETRTHGQFPQSRKSESEQRDVSREPLVMASQISGLDPLHGYLKHGNLVVEMKVPYMELQGHHEKFIERTFAPQPARTNETAPPKKEPTSVRQVELKPAQGQGLYFE
jgi:hypothetical protein